MARLGRRGGIRRRRDLSGGPRRARPGKRLSRLLTNPSALSRCVCEGGAGWGHGAGTALTSTSDRKRRSNMDEAITRSSRFLALSGVAGIIFGIVALVWPNITLVALVALFWAYAFVAA